MCKYNEADALKPVEVFWTQWQQLTGKKSEVLVTKLRLLNTKNTQVNMVLDQSAQGKRQVWNYFKLPSSP